jgi:hypothetical protein
MDGDNETVADEIQRQVAGIPRFDERDEPLPALGIAGGVFPRNQRRLSRTSNALMLP